MALSLYEELGRDSYIFNEDFHKPTDPTWIINRPWKRYCEYREVDQDTVISSAQTINRWESPPLGWAKLNVDGTVTSSQGKANCGGVVRDNRGLWISGFTQLLGNCEAYAAEEWALLLGLRLALEEGYKRVIVESDAKTLMDNVL
ncbi:hypothetical protein QN277_016549 [Acacia crassicarpa]|uniref:RNase H type-1 domain-containing protein n=1 Tax=Acacia crassicarpa TaxID=499986 RepID=A0AAE1TAL9_9FABA|nr:hypothetical protein QN277_016549 [Acacia crassicarpa]